MAELTTQTPESDDLREVADSTLRDHLELECKRADEERERAHRLVEELREARRPWWRRW